MNAPVKILLIRLSSFGDIVQALGVPAVLKKKFQSCEVHWVVRSDFSQLLSHHPHIDKVWSFKRQQGLWGWFQLCRELRTQGFTHVYDAHSNLRSSVLSLLFRLGGWRGQWLRRSKQRWRRFLLFQLGWNFFPQPYRGQISFLEPLKKWQIDSAPEKESQFFIPPEITSKALHQVSHLRPFVALVPSAAWAKKRWPLAHWKKLIQETHQNMVILGGPEDHFCQELSDLAPERVVNLAGELTLIESCAVLELSEAVISADTGLLHVADLLAKKNLSLIGPTAFGFPSNTNSKVLEVELGCRPCSKDGRGGCRQKVYQRCMVEILPKTVAKELHQLTGGAPSRDFSTDSHQ